MPISTRSSRRWGIAVAAALFTASVSSGAGWVRTYGAGSGVGVAVAGGGVIVVTARIGWTTVFDFGLDIEGNVLWSKPVTTNSSSYPLGSTRTPDGGVAIVGSDGNESTFLLKLSSDGATSFQSGVGYDFSYEPTCSSVDAFPDGSLVIAGNVWEIYDFHDYHPVVYKMSSTGSLVWGRRLTGTGSSVAAAAGSLVAWMLPSAVQFLDGSTGTPVSAWSVPASTIRGRASGRVAIGSALRVFDLASNGAITRSVELAGNGMTGVVTLREAPSDGSLLVVLSAPNGSGDADDAAAVVWLTDAGTVASQVTLGPPVSIAAVAETALGVVVVGTSAGEIFVAGFDRSGLSNCWPTSLAGISAAPVSTTATAAGGTIVSDFKIAGSRALVATTDPTSISLSCGMADGLGDRVFDDLDGDGIQDAGEPGVPNVTVQLLDSGGSFVASGMTDPSGMFWFAGAADAPYQLALMLPSGKVLTESDAGTDDTKDSDFDPVTRLTPLIPPGGSRATWDAGLVPTPPCTPPGAPSLAVPAVDCSGVTLSWTPGSGDTMFYNLYRSVGGCPASGWTVISGLEPVTTFKDTFVQSGTTYSYVVRGSCDPDGAVESPQSNCTTVMASGIPKNMPTPTVNLACGSNTVSWAAVVDATDYEVWGEAGSTCSSFSLLAASTGGATSWVHSTVAPGSTWGYSIFAIHPCGRSYRSECAKVTSLAPPGAPVQSAPVAGNGQVQVRWADVSNETGYTVERGASGGPYLPVSPVLPAGTVSHIDTGLANGTSYCYVVTAANTCGSATSSPERCAIPVDCLAAPAFAGVSSVTSGATSTCGLIVSWPAAIPACSGVGSTVYRVYRSTSTPVIPGPSTLRAGGVGVTSWSDATDLVDGTRYHYLVHAVNTASGAEDGNGVEGSAIPTGPVGTATLSETFEAGSGFDLTGWTHAPGAGTTDWAWSTQGSQSPTHSWFAADVPSVSDKWLASPSFMVGSSTTLGFWHTRSFARKNSNGLCVDGGTLEITTDGGTNWGVVPAASFTAGAYDGTITDAANPLNGRSAWCAGTIGSPTAVSVSLGAYAGQTARIRWHEGDSGRSGRGGYSTGIGWYVDSVTLAQVPSIGVCTTLTSNSGARPVPDGSQAPGTAMKGIRTGANVNVTWDAATCTAADYAAFWGALGSFATFTGGFCPLGTSGSASLAIPGNSFWVLAGTDGGSVSSFGVSSAGAQEAFGGWSAVCPALSVQNTVTTCP